MHIKTAGTTWLEELIGLAEAGGEGSSSRKRSTPKHCEHVEELCGPYATVIDIDRAKLPVRRQTCSAWTGEQVHRRACATTRRIPASTRASGNCCTSAFKLAAKMGQRYLDLLKDTRQSSPGT